MNRPVTRSRRRFLAAIGASCLIAGCTGDGDEASPTPSPTQTPTPTPTPDPTPSPTPEGSDHQPTGFTPLTDGNGEMYQGYPVSLYADGGNHPPDSHRKIVERRLEEVLPRDESGSPAENGQTGMISIGMSNTSQAFGEFMRSISDEPQMADHVTLVNGAQGGQAAHAWANASSPWSEAKSRADHRSLTPAQIQVAWMKLCLIRPWRIGEFPITAHQLRDHIITIVKEANRHFPNLSVIYLSSRTYGGYDSIRLNPEPYAYEGGFSVQSVIQHQIDGHAGLNADSEQGEIEAPALLWGPYLWADGPDGREFDDLVWERDDFIHDGIHPSGSGMQKVADLLLEYFTTHSLATPWFVE